MARLLMKDITKLLNNRSNVRNISIIALSDDDSETLTDSLLDASGISVADNFPPYAPWAECNSREVNVDPVCASLHTTVGDKNDDDDDDELHNQYVVNVIKIANENGMHEVVIADGVIIVVDSDLNVNANVETLIQKAINEKLKIILFVNMNNVDANLSTITEANLERLYSELYDTVHAMKHLIEQYSNDNLYSIDVMSSIVFGCIGQGWAFNLHSFAEIYAKSFSKLKSTTLAEKLWGDNFYSFAEKKWSKVKRDHTYERSFVQFILKPIHKLYEATAQNNRTEIENMLSKLPIHLEDREKERCGTVLLRKIMQKWCSVANCLLPLVVHHFPSPTAAQSYRFDVIYRGSDQEIISATKEFHEQGKLVMQITKTLQTNDYGRRYAFGRILSGKLKKGDRVRIITDHGIFPNKKVDKILFLSGRFVDEITDTFSGSVCAVCGFDSYINGMAVLTG